MGKVSVFRWNSWSHRTSVSSCVMWRSKHIHSMLLLGGLKEVTPQHPTPDPTPGSPSSCSFVISPVQVPQLEGDQLPTGTLWQHLTLWLHQMHSLSWSFLMVLRSGGQRGTCSGPTCAQPSRGVVSPVAISDNWNKVGARIKIFLFSPSGKISWDIVRKRLEGWHSEVKQASSTPRWPT